MRPLLVLLISLVLSVVALGADLRELAVRMGDSTGSGFSGAVIGATGPNCDRYLIATCSHGPEPGSQVWVQHEGTSQRVPAAPIWVPPKQHLDLALFSVPCTVDVIRTRIPPIPKSLQPGQEVWGWGYTRGGPAQAFSGRITSVSGKTGTMTSLTQHGDSGAILWDRTGAPVGVQWGSDFQGETVFTPLYFAYTVLPQQRETGCFGGNGLFGRRNQLSGRITVPVGTQPVCVPQPQISIPQPVQDRVVQVIRERLPITDPEEDQTNLEQTAELVDFINNVRDELEEDHENKLEQILETIRDEGDDLQALLELILIIKGQDDIKDLLPNPPVTPARTATYQSAKVRRDEIVARYIKLAKERARR